MKKSLILSILMVSVTSFASTLTVGETNKIKCESLTEEFSSSFSGMVNLAVQSDEVVFADTFLATIDKKQGTKNLLTLEEMHGTRQLIKAGQLAKDEVTSVELLSNEEGQGKSHLIMNLGLQGTNSRLIVNGEVIYTSSCSVVMAEQK